MRSPLVTRKRHEAEVSQAKLDIRFDMLAKVNEAQAESALWRVEYRKIRDWIVDTATSYQGSDPRIKGLFAQAAEIFGRP
jgi:hypothetical protein